MSYRELARWFEQGTNTEADLAAAKWWFERAAEAGSEAEAILVARYRDPAR